MRILYLNHNVAGYGTYHRAFHLGREMTRHGHSVTLVTTSRTRRTGGEEREVDGVRVIEAPDLWTGGARQGWDPWNTGWRLGRLRTELFDLVHAFDSRPAVIGPALALQRRAGMPLFLDWADWWGRGGTITDRSGWLVRTFFGPVETWFEESFRVAATANTAISELLRERCIALGVAAERVSLLPNGCTAPVSVPGGARGARGRCGIGAEPLVVHVGVIQPGDARLLFDAWRGVLRTLPAARLVLVGNYRGAVPPDVAGSVVRTGFVGEAALRDWLGAADVAVVPLRDSLANRARWPSKVNEYLSAGLPVVLPAVGAAAELIARHGAGAVCAPTSEALAEGLAATVQDAAGRTRMSEAGRALAAGELAWPRIGDRLVEFYDHWASSVARRSSGAATADTRRPGPAVSQ